MSSPNSQLQYMQEVCSKTANLLFQPYFVQPGHFVYRDETLQGGKKTARYLLVSVDTCQQIELFDHALLAECLGRALKTELDTDNLTLTPLRVTDEGEVVFRTQGKTFSWLRGTLKELAGSGAEAGQHGSVPPMDSAVADGDGTLISGASPRGRYAFSCAVAHDRKRATLTVRDVQEDSGPHELLTEQASGDAILTFDLHAQHNLAQTLFWCSEQAQTLFWLSERDGFFHLYAAPLDGGEPRQLTQGEFTVQKIAAVDEQRKLVYFLASGREIHTNLTHNYLYSVGFDGEELKLLSRDKGDHRVWFAPDCGLFLDEVSSCDQPARVYLCTPEGARLALVCETDIAPLEASGLSYPIPILHKAADHKTDLCGILTLPTQFAGEKAPLACFYSSDPFHPSVPATFAGMLHGLSQRLANLGIASVMIDGRGAPGRGSAFRDGFPVPSMDDQIAALNQLCDKYPFLDRQKIALWGHLGAQERFVTGQARAFYCALVNLDKPPAGQTGPQTDPLWVLDALRKSLL